MEGKAIAEDRDFGEKQMKGNEIAEYREGESRCKVRR